MTDTLPAPTTEQATTEYTRKDRGLWLAGILAAIALIVTVASLIGADNVQAAVIVLGGIVGIGLVYLALTRFELFVLSCLFLRSSLDVVGGAGTTVTNPSSLISLTFMAASLLWLAARSYRGVRMASTLTAPLIFFAGACFLSTLTSRLHGVSFVEFSRILSVVVMALVLERLATTPQAVRRIMIAAMGSAVIPLVASMLAYAAGAPLLDRRAALEDGIQRVRGTFDQANGFSRYLLFIMIMAVALYPHMPKRWRLPWLASLVGLGVLMILTYTRSSWMALVVGLLVVGWLQSKRLLLALIVIGLGVALFVPTVVDRFSDLTADNGPDTALTGEGNSLAWRFSYWTEVIELAADNPVTGIGLRVTEELSAGEKQPHNDFVRAYVELGAIGLMAYILLVIAMARVAVRGVRDAHAGWQRGVAVGFAGCLMAFVLVSLVANVMSQAVVLWYVFAFAACAAAVGRFGWIEKKNALEVGGRPAPVQD
ncbi:MAG TPA: O-antigen ligase family protein [Acidimicrobiales bacterium]|nr:O-antigen ligase family protein [Acidimicrobiales bacterium]